MRGKDKRISVYIVKTADVYKHIIFMSEDIMDIANYLNISPSDIVKFKNTNKMFGSYRVGQIDLKYKSWECAN